METKKSIVVLGGGITGLAAAWYLQKHSDHFDVTLFEKSDRLGGVIGSHREGNWLVERGADNFATLIPDALELTRELGLEGEMIRPNEANRLARVVAHGNLCPIPQGFSLMQPTRMDAILASRVLSLPGKLRVLWEYFVSRRTDSRDESLQDFAIRRLGREAFDRLVEPIVGGIFTARADQLSMQAAMPEFVAMERDHGGLIRSFLAKKKKAKQSQDAKHAVAKKASGARYDQFVAPKQGMQWWLDQIVCRLDRVHKKLNTSVKSVEKSGDRWMVELEDGSSSPFDAVVVALPAPAAKRLFQSKLPELSGYYEQIPYASSAVAVMVVERDEIAPADLCFGIVVPQVEHRDCLAISMSSEKYPGRVDENKVLLRVFMGGAVRPDLNQKSDAELLEIAWREVQTLLKLKSRPVWQSLVRWNEAMPQYHVGHLDRVAAIDAIIQRDPTLQVAGNAYRGVGIPQCVRSARLAVQQLWNHWKVG